MARIVQDEATLQLCISKVDEGNLCVTGLIDESDLCTDFGNITAVAEYRADTTILTADNAVISADYDH